MPRGALLALAVLLIPRPVAAQVPVSPPIGATTCGIHCGTERWLLKTLTDPDTGRIHHDTVAATVEQLVALQRPAHLSPNARAAPVEVTVYRVEARLAHLYHESDHDYHLVLASLQDPAITMIAEVPAPECSRVCASGRAQLYAQLRQRLMDRLDSPQSEREPLLRVTGVGFFDYRHGQRGLAPNAIELHPVLNVEFLTSPRAARQGNLAVPARHGPPNGGVAVTTGGMFSTNRDLKRLADSSFH